MVSEIQVKESEIPLTMEMWNPISTDKESIIHEVESTIQDCLRFPYMGRFKRVRVQPHKTPVIDAGIEINKRLPINFIDPRDEVGYSGRFIS